MSVKRSVSYAVLIVISAVLFIVALKVETIERYQLVLTVLAFAGLLWYALETRFLVLETRRLVELQEKANIVKLQPAISIIPRETDDMCFRPIIQNHSSVTARVFVKLVLKIEDKVIEDAQIRQYDGKVPIQIPPNSAVNGQPHLENIFIGVLQADLRRRNVPVTISFECENWSSELEAEGISRAHAQKNVFSWFWRWDVGGGAWVYSA